jgi:hypothetical protein
MMLVLVLAWTRIFAPACGPATWQTEALQVAYTLLPVAAAVVSVADPPIAPMRHRLYWEAGAYKCDEDGFEKEILLPPEKLLPPSAERVWIIGNHDDWERQLVEEMPQLQGKVERH